jgi:hypothetical protein
MMQHRRRLVALASAVGLFAAIVAAPASATEQTTAPTIVYSELYLMLIAAYPAGWVMDSCMAVLEVTGRTDGVCLDTLQLEYFYPDGTFGRMPWYVEAASPTGWAVEADPCASLPLDDWDLWAWYVDWANGWYYETGPDLTDEQVALYTQCWGWWF